MNIPLGTGFDTHTHTENAFHSMLQLVDVLPHTHNAQSIGVQAKDLGPKTTWMT